MSKYEYSTVIIAKHRVQMCSYRSTKNHIANSTYKRDTSTCIRKISSSWNPYKFTDWLCSFLKNYTLCYYLIAMVDCKTKCSCLCLCYIQNTILDLCTHTNASKI